MDSSVVQLIHVGGKIIAYTVACEPRIYFKYTVVTRVHVLHVLSTSYMYSTTVVHAISCVLYCTLRCTQRLLGIRVYCCAHCTSRRYSPAPRMYHASQQTVSADRLQHNSQHRKTRGIKTAIYAPSIRPDLCIWSRGFSGTCRRASLTSFRGCDPHVTISAERKFAAQTHTQAGAVAEGQYTCDRCKRDKKPVKSFSSANDMDPGSMPDQLKGLTQAEEMRIAKGCPVMRAYRLTGGQRGYGGHVVNLAQNIGDFVNSLPRPARELSIIVVRRQDGEGIHKDLLVRRQRVFDALNWLKANNPFYSDISINTDNLNSLPDNGSLQDLYETSGDDDLDSERDTGPQQDGASGGDEDTESFLRSVVGNGMQEDAITDLLLQKMLRAQRRGTVAGASSRSQTAATAVPWPEMEDTPLNEFKTQGLCSLCFPALFPCGSGDPTHVARRQKVTNAEGFKHLLRYYDVDKNGGRYRFATHLRFPHWAQNMLEIHRTLSQASFFVKHHEGDAALTVDDLKAMLRNGGAQASALVKRMLRYAANITGSNAYWHARQQELQSTFAAKGCATVFITLSAADNHLEDLHPLMPPSYPDTARGRRLAVINNPHIVDWYFGHRVNALMKSFFDGVLGYEWRWFRF